LQERPGGGGQGCTCCCTCSAALWYWSRTRAVSAAGQAADPWCTKGMLGWLVTAVRVPFCCCCCCCCPVSVGQVVVLAVAAAAVLPGKTVAGCRHSCDPPLWVTRRQGGALCARCCWACAVIAWLCSTTCSSVTLQSLLPGRHCSAQLIRWEAPARWPRLAPGSAADMGAWCGQTGPPGQGSWAQAGHVPLSHAARSA